MVPGDSNILLRVDSGTKAEWKRRAAGEGLSLTRLIFSSVEARLGAAGPVASAGPVPAPKDEPAPKPVKEPPKRPERIKSWRDPVAVEPPPRREHSVRCDCLACRG